MKLILATIVVIGSCLLFSTGSADEESSSPTIPLPFNADTPKNARFFFNSDPCTNSMYQFLNITDAKCSLQCFFQAGYQQGGYCDENNACQCNVVQ